MVTSEAQPGWAVIELEAMQHDGRPARRGELRLQAADQGDAAEVVHRDDQLRVDAGQPGDARARHQPVHHVGQPADAGHGLGRPSGVDRSATTSAPRRSTVTTRWPSSRSSAVVAAPMPDAAPVTTYVRR